MWITGEERGRITSECVVKWLQRIMVPGGERLSSTKRLWRGNLVTKESGARREIKTTGEDIGQRSPKLPGRPDDLMSVCVDERSWKS